MISAALVFGSTFLTVFALGLQSLNVNQGHYLAAAATSAFISTGHLWLYKVMPQPSWLDLGGYYAGGIVGILASMWFHRRVRTWWQRWRTSLHHRLPGQRPPKAPPPRPLWVQGPFGSGHWCAGDSCLLCGTLRRDDVH